MATKQTTHGFALLMTLIVVTVVVSITATIIELTIKQLTLSVTAKDSEVAFHAANAGMECAQFTRLVNASASIENGATTITTNCMGLTQTLTRVNTLGVAVDPSTATVYRYRGSITWPAGNPSNNRCSVIDMFVIMNANDGNEVSLGDTSSGGDPISDEIPGYPSTDPFICAANSNCTLVSSVGYNSLCNATSSAGTVRREILLDF